MHKFRWKPSEYNSLPPHEKAFVIASIQIRTEQEHKEQQKLKISSLIKSYNNADLFIGFEEDRKYADSNLDTYLNGNTDGCYYYGLSDNIKNSIVAQNITQYAYSYSDEEPEEAWTFEYQHKWSETDIEYVTESGYVSVGTRNIYALDVKDVFEYYSKGTNDLLTSNELNNLFFGQETETSAYCWLRSAYKNDTDNIWYIDGTIGFKDSKLFSILEPLQ